MNDLNDFLDLNKYKKQKKIGKGTFGEVFEAVDEATGKVYAAKVSLNELKEENKSFVTNLKREVDINAQLNHPAILKFIGYCPIDFQNEPKPVIISEFASNGTLGDCINLERQSLSPNSWNDTKKLINIFGIASAMQYLHSHDIIHRDLKPGNILEDDFLFPKVSDFGLSKSFHQNIESMTAQSTLGVKGTPIYIPPEGWDTNEYTKAGDVYAFAIIVYELITLEEPFKGFTMMMICSQVAYKGYRPSFKFSIPECYQQLITKCWSQNPDERPTFQEIVEELKSNHDFITDSVDEDEFLDYVDYIENYNTTFDASKKFKRITFSKEPQKVIETESEPPEKICETEQKPKKDIIHQETLPPVQTPKASFGDSSIQITNDSDGQQVLKIECKKGSNKEFQNALKSLLGNLISTQNQSNDESSDDSSEDLILTPSKNISTNINNNDDGEEEEAEPDYSKLPKNNLNIQPSCKVIDDYAFKNDESLTYVVIPSSVTQIGMSAFENCTSLVRVDIPSSVTKIGNFCFQKCTSLRMVTIPSTVLQIGMNAFNGCEKLRYAKLPESLAKISANLFNECFELRDIEIPSKVTEIAMNAFCGCRKLKEISIPSSVARILNSAFAGCTGITKVTISKSVKQIGPLAFSRCKSLTNINFIDNTVLTQIGRCCFESCELIEQITLPSSVQQIGENAFSNCTALKKIVIPASTRQIGEFAFSNCNSLIEIEFLKPSVLAKLEKNTFENCKSLIKIEIPESVTKIDNNCFNNCEALNSLTFASPSKLNYIEHYVISGCSSITQIKLPPSLKHMNDNAFISSSLQQLLVPSSIKNLIKKDINSYHNIDVKYIDE